MSSNGFLFRKINKLICPLLSLAEGILLTSGRNSFKSAKYSEKTGHKIKITYENSWDLLKNAQFYGIIMYLERV